MGEYLQYEPDEYTLASDTDYESDSSSEYESELYELESDQDV